MADTPPPVAPDDGGGGSGAPAGETGPGPADGGDAGNAAPTGGGNVYLALLRIPGTARFVVAGVVGRLPLSMFSLGIVFLVTANGDGYGLAGALAALCALASSVTSPVFGRLADRHGQAAVLVPATLSNGVALVMLTVAAQVRAADIVLLLIAVLVGGTFPPIESMVRARWTALLGGTPRLQTAFALESVLDEVVFLVGPVVVAALATGVAAWTGVAAALVCAVGGSLALAAQRGTEPPRRSPAVHAADRALSAPGLWVIMVVMFAVGAEFGGIDIGIAAFAKEQGATGATGVLLASFSVGSLGAGLFYGSRHWRWPAERRFVMSLLALVAGQAAVTLAATTLTMAVAAMLAGLAISPTFIVGYSLVEAVVPPVALTEGFAWATTGTGLGYAVGVAAAGRLIDVGTSRTAFAAGIAAAAIAAATAAVGSRWLHRLPVAAPAA